MATHYTRPLRYIFDLQDLHAFSASPAHEELLKFIAAVNAAVAEKSQSAAAAAACDVSPACQALLAVLHELSSWVDAIPPIQQPMRYGNKAFRQWHARLVERAADLCATVLPPTAAAAAVEVAAYLCESFGNPVRIDYGTGHETTFVVFLSECRRCPVAPYSMDCEPRACTAAVSNEERRLSHKGVLYVVRTPRRYRSAQCASAKWGCLRPRTCPRWASRCSQRIYRPCAACSAPIGWVSNTAARRFRSC